MGNDDNSLDNRPGSLLDTVQWNSDGLVPAIAQDINSKKVLMMAWMNREALSMTIKKGQAVYWSRSKQRIWHKGESSGHTQNVHDIQIDCDGDTLLLLVEQTGGIACHTGRQSCLYRRHGDTGWEVFEDPIKDPSEIY